MKRHPSFVVSLDCGREADVLDGFQPGAVLVAVAGVGVVDGQAEVIVGLVEGFAWFAPEAESSRDDTVCDVAKFVGGSAKPLELDLLRLGGALRIVVVDLAGERVPNAGPWRRSRTSTVLAWPALVTSTGASSGGTGWGRCAGLRVGPGR